jgi:hypothetical protein
MKDKQYAEKAIICLQEQLARAKTENRKAKIQSRLNKWINFLKGE